MPLQPDRRSLFASVSSPLHPCWSVLSFADLYKTHTSGNQWFPSRFFFLLPELLVMTCSLGGLKWLSSLSWTRSVPKFTLESVFPGPNPPWCAIPISGYLGSYKSGSRPQKQRVVRSLWSWMGGGSGVICEVKEVSQLSWKSAETRKARHQWQSNSEDKKLAVTSPGPTFSPWPPVLLSEWHLWSSLQCKRDDSGKFWKANVADDVTIAFWLHLHHFFHQLLVKVRGKRFIVIPLR